MKTFRNITIGLVVLGLNSLNAAGTNVVNQKKHQTITPVLNPISQRIMAGSLPQHTITGKSYSVTYSFTSNLPFKMPTPFNNTQSFLSDQREFSIHDGCDKKALHPNQSCSITINFMSTKAGRKGAAIYLNFGNNQLPLKLDFANGLGAQQLGVNYQPNHYGANVPSAASAFNNHDVFYVGGGTAPTTNVGTELAQLKAAGFTMVRSYATTAYTLIELINQAAALGMSVVYEVPIPMGGSCNPTAIPADPSTTTGQAIQVLNSVIDQVTPQVFQQTVTLVFAGHENYDGTTNGAAYLQCAISQIQKDLINKSVNSGTSSDIPVTTAFLSEIIDNPVPSQSVVNSILNTSGPTAPIAFDTYPFQWGVPVADAVTTAATPHSIAWDFTQIANQNYQPAPPYYLIAETGWVAPYQAPGGKPYHYPAGYVCATQGTCQPGTANASSYFQSLYTFIQTANNNASLLGFIAYDVPTAVVSDPDNAENFYGLFDQNCSLKDPALVPNASFTPSNYPACMGFSQGALIPIDIYTGQQSAPFTVQITQTNPATSQDASLTLTVPVKNRTNPATPWPYFVIYNNAIIAITGSATGTTCTTTATVVNGVPSFTSAAPCNCTPQGCFLPNPF